MGTRANIIVKDRYIAIQLYLHLDGYPDGAAGVLESLKEALPFAWKLPRMEADDMAAAIVRAWKEEGGGDVYIDGTASLPDSLHDDINYYYIISPNEEKEKWEVKTYSREGLLLSTTFLG